MSGFDLVNEMGKNRHFSALSSEAAVQTCLSVGESISSFAKLLSKFKNGELEQRPRIPNYRRSGYQVVSFPRRCLKLVDRQIRLPLGRQTKAWFGLSEFFVPMPSNLDFKKIKELRVLPRNKCFYAEFVYTAEPIETHLDQLHALGLDHGINNWLTGVSTVGTNFIIDGKRLKSINQWYNKQVAKLMTDKPNGFWSNRLALLTEKRNRQMRDAINKAAKLVINHCLKNKIGTIVFGWNQGQKQEVNLGDKNNQSFVQIPTGRLKDRIQQLCSLYGIQLVETEESYTSQSSFLDADEIPVYGEKPDEWKSSGKRIRRGLFQSADGSLINADCNGASNILRKVAVTLGLDLSGISRGVLTTPLKLNLWAIQESQRL
ncbi:transposase [Spirulina subsalsa FACHB-351]|uniref:Transposase n=1 Tax=Spirulina subsalsa FACHB-351 TaxID=234711 RepID=A0ABT3L2U2_9CYAN|nr:transposase [Spirulina subsalsa FACHB-351]